MTNPNRSPVRARLQLAAVLVIGATVSSVLGGLQITRNSLSFDGGLNAQVAREMVEHGRYATTGPWRDFDPIVTTGPTVVLPAALAFKALDVSTLSAQITSLVYFVGLFVLALWFAHRHAGLAGAAVALVLLVSTPSAFDIGLRLYGEVPAVVFVLAALLALDRVAPTATLRWSLVAGVFFGLAFLTKVSILIPLAAWVPLLLIDRVTGRRFGLRAVAGLGAGFALPVIPFEWIKMIVLTPPTYMRWWLVFTGRAVTQGLPHHGVDTHGTLPKLSTHLHILARQTDLPMWSLVAVLLAPWILLAILGCLRGKTWGPGRSASVWLLAGAACTHTIWWVLFTPTNKAWLRRMYPGLILQEILIAIVLAWAVQSLLPASGTASARWRRRFLLASLGVPAAVLAAGTAVFVARNLGRTGFEMKTDPARGQDESMAAFMASLPSDAAFYGKGWWRAPVLAAFSGRRVGDINDLPMSRYDQPLDRAYLVTGRYAVSLAPQWVSAVLARSEASLVRREGDNSLYRLSMVMPYRPIPEPSSADELLSLYSADVAGYPFASGIYGRTPHGLRVAADVSAFRLLQTDQPCLVAELLVAPNAAGRSRLEFRVDGETIASKTVETGRTLRYASRIETPPDDRPARRLVEIVARREAPTNPFALPQARRGSVAISTIGFDACPRDRLGQFIEVPAGDPSRTAAHAREDR